MPASTRHALAPMIDKLTRQSALGSAEVRALFDLPHRISISEAGHYIVREGDNSGSCTVICSGFAYRSKIAGSGARQILSVHLRGDLVDLQNSLLGEADHNVQALARVEVAHIAQRALLDVAEAYPAIARALWRDTLVEGSIFREWILNVGQRDARQRISHLLCELVLRQEEAKVCEGPCYQWPFTQEQVGDATGLTSVHVNRTIQCLRKDGLIETNGRSVTIVDWPRLQRAGDFSRAYLHQHPVAA
jgi:CRP-like cAMP-binding protein